MMTPALDTEYAAGFTNGTPSTARWSYSRWSGDTTPYMEATLTMDPYPAAAMAPPNTWQHTTVPATLTFIIWSHRSIGYDSNARVDSGPAPGGTSMAALLTSPL